MDAEVAFANLGPGGPQQPFFRQQAFRQAIQHAICAHLVLRRRPQRQTNHPGRQQHQ